LAKEDAVTGFTIADNAKSALLTSQSCASKKTGTYAGKREEISVDSRRVATSYDMTAVTDKG
jgi:hypothetical protein